MLSMQWHTRVNCVAQSPILLLCYSRSLCRGCEEVPATTRSVTDVVSAPSLTMLETRCIIHI